MITAPGRSAPGPPVRWTAGHRLLVAKDEQISDTEAAALASSVDASGAHAADLERYGRLLFKAAFYEETWRQLVADAATEPCLELAMRGPAGSGQPSPHALRWEALHDGSTAIAARGTAIKPGSPGLLPVGIVRLVPPAVPLIQNNPGSLSPVNRIPRVLYAIGSRLTDPRVRAGAEFMGILRHLERKGRSFSRAFCSRHPRSRSPANSSASSPTCCTSSGAAARSQRALREAPAAGGHPGRRRRLADGRAAA